MVKVQNPGIEIPGYGRQDFKRIQHLPVPEFKLWLCKMGEELFNQGAAAERAELERRLKIRFGFGPVRLARLYKENEK